MAGGPNPNAWHQWYHCVGSTYGTWLRGDPRGFRTFHHREHVEGDYRKPPPPGVYAPVFTASRKALRHPPVQLSGAQRGLICRAMVERLIQNQAELIALAVATNHFHLLARFPHLDHADRQRLGASVIRDGRDPAPRHFLGLARKHAAHTLLNHGLKPASPVWAARPKCEPIRDRPHQVNTARYIREHARQDAAVWFMGSFVDA